MAGKSLVNYKIYFFMKQLLQIGLVNKELHADGFGMVQFYQYIYIAFRSGLPTSRRAEQISFLHRDTCKVMLD